jgi:hypothetical protein
MKTHDAEMRFDLRRNAMPRWTVLALAASPTLTLAGAASAKVTHDALESAAGLHADRARLFVHGNEQPAIVNDLKSGASATGAVALWLGPGTIAHFRDLTIRPEPDKR